MAQVLPRTHRAAGERGHWEEVAVQSMEPCSGRLWLGFKNLSVARTAQMISGRVGVKGSARGADAEASGWQPEPCVHAPPFEPV